MNTQSQLEHAERLLEQWHATCSHPQPNRFDIEIGPEDLLLAASALIDGEWGYLAAITGLDPGVDTGVLWVLYHFAEGAAIATLRVVVPRENPEVPTIRYLTSLAGIYEQELGEILGVTIVGADYNGRLFLPDDWPEDVYPLRKDFELA